MLMVCRSFKKARAHGDIVGDQRVGGSEPNKTKKLGHEILSTLDNDTLKERG